MFPRRAMVPRRRPLLRAAVVGGGAYVAGRAAASRSAQRAGQEAGQDARISDLEQAQQPQAQQPQAQQPQVPEPRPDPSMLDQLSELARLHDAGALNDAEFSAAKAKLLG
jgi:Short C-terminal domain